MDTLTDVGARVSQLPQKVYDQVEEWDLGRTIKTIWRRKWIILATIAIITGGMVLYVETATPRYTASLQILFEGNQNKPIDFEAAIAGQPQDEASILGEIQVLKSRELAQRVIEALQLHNNPEFNPEMGRNGGSLDLTGKLAEVIREWLPRFKSATNDAAGLSLTEEQRTQMKQDAMIDIFLSQLSAEGIGRSRAIEVSFKSDNPITAAEVCNTLANLYLVSRLEDKFENARTASKWLAERADKLRAEVEQAERAALDYRRANNLLQGERVTFLAERLGELNTKLTDATMQRSEAEANLAQVRRLASGADLASASQVLDSALYQRLREQQVQLERKEAEASDLGASHPASILIRAEKATLSQNVDTEVRKVIRSLENKVEVARRREAAIEKEVRGAKDEMGGANSASVEVRSLERNVEANRLLLDKFMTAFTEQTAQQDANSQAPDARIISHAAIPIAPSFPMKILMITLAFVPSSLIGILLAFTAEMLDRGYRSATQVEHDLGLPVLSHIPQIKRGGEKREKLVATVLDNPASAYAEAIRSIYTRLMFAFAERQPKSLLFVSSEAGEGKTTIAVSVARMQARMGRKVILLDADFRHSRITNILGLPLSGGTLDLLNGSKTVEEVIQEDASSSMHVIAAGNYSVDYVDSLSQEQLLSLLRRLEALYDLVIIDAPPVCALIDAQVIATIADATVLVVRWGKTRKETVRYTADRLMTGGGNLVGVILSEVDVRKLAQYHYGDAGHYEGGSKKYYT
jgi:polysaccharide biosynthesis transport protein